MPKMKKSDKVFLRKERSGKRIKVKQMFMESANQLKKKKQVIDLLNFYPVYLMPIAPILLRLNDKVRS